MAHRRLIIAAALLLVGLVAALTWLNFAVLTYGPTPQNPHLLVGAQAAPKLGATGTPEESQLATYTLGLFLSTLGLAGATAVLVYVTLNFGIRQQRETKLLQRAYVSVDPKGIRPWHGSERQILAHVSVENTGRLPAQSLSWTLVIETSNDGDRTSFPIPPTRRGSHVLTSGSGMTRGTRPIEFDGKPYCFVWGQIDYDDGFGKRQFTKFCHRYNCSRADFVAQRKIGASDARLHEYGNAAS